MRTCLRQRIYNIHAYVISRHIGERHHCSEVVKSQVSNHICKGDIQSTNRGQPYEGRLEGTHVAAAMHKIIREVAQRKQPLPDVHV